MINGGRILAVDTFYHPDKAKTVGVLFDSWDQDEPSMVIESWTTDFGPYIPGQFYLRELPPTMKLLEQVDIKEIGVLIVDGFLQVYDSEVGRLEKGLGLRLGEILRIEKKDLVLVGVAKTDYREQGERWKLAEPWKRGPLGSKPLWVQVDGMRIPDLMHGLGQMKGNCRLPDMLRILDKETKKEVA